MELQVRGFQAARKSERSEGRYMRVITSISETGEYLIARQIGVVKTLNAWTATETAQRLQKTTTLR